MGYGIEDIKDSRHVIYSRGVPAKYHLYYMSQDNVKKDYKYLRVLMQKFIVPNDILKQHISDMEYEFDIADKYNSMLGVIVRRVVEYEHSVGGAIWGFYNVPSVFEIISLAKSTMKEYNLKKIFLCIDEEEGLDEFIKEFGDKLIYSKRKRIRLFTNGVPLPRTDGMIEEGTFACKDGGLQKHDWDYAGEIYIIGKCKQIIAMGSTAAAFIQIAKKEIEDNMLFLRE